ncbi:MAG: RHS repeat-associated core domain-containing protein [Desulfobacteraceae bacterium]|nr:RHS repeat-associated core domain-containing protein [Desulfobacteraceae bacterium]
MTETGLYYYGFRYYSSELGRWINRDPIGENGGINIYCFVGNLPNSRIDMYGLTACRCKCNSTQKDLKDIINKYINTIIQDTKADLNEVFKKLVPSTSSFGNLTAIEDWIYTNHKSHLTGVYDNYKRGIFAPCMNLCGQCVGTDKLGHFIEEGWLYHQVFEMTGKEEYATGLGMWLEGLVPPDPATVTWIKKTSIDIVWSGGTFKGLKLYDVFGSFGDGLFGRNSLSAGMADLEANRAGLSFWKSLKKSGTKFKFDVCSYVTEKWDEDKNPNALPDKKPKP